MINGVSYKIHIFVITGFFLLHCHGNNENLHICILYFSEYYDDTLKI